MVSFLGLPKVELEPANPTRKRRAFSRTPRIALALAPLNSIGIVKIAGGIGVGDGVILAEGEREYDAPDEREGVGVVVDVFVAVPEPVADLVGRAERDPLAVPVEL